MFCHLYAQNDGHVQFCIIIWNYFYVAETFAVNSLMLAKNKTAAEANVSFYYV